MSNEWKSATISKQSKDKPLSSSSQLESKIWTAKNTNQSPQYAKDFTRGDLSVCTKKGIPKINTVYSNDRMSVDVFVQRDNIRLKYFTKIRRRNVHIALNGIHIRPQCSQASHCDTVTRVCTFHIERRLGGSTVNNTNDVSHPSSVRHNHRHVNQICHLL